MATQDGERDSVDRREACVRAHLECRDHSQATSAALSLYGHEIMRFLLVRMRDREQAEEAFSKFCEDLWQGLPGFAWRSSLRTWLFVMARHACARQRRWRLQDQKRWADDPSRDFAEARARVRTQTAPYLRTDAKRRVRALREQLDDDQQTLLVLRLERGLPWRELAMVMGEAPLDAGDAELNRASARIRTRYQVAKKRLRELALAAGVIEQD